MDGLYEMDNVQDFVEDEEEGELESGSWLRNTGIGQLYRGFGVRAGASVLIFL